METENKRGRRNEMVGEVVSDKMDKTIKVLVYRKVKHAVYGKYIRRTSKFTAHDEKNQAKVGDKVLIYETRPLSKSKRWMFSKVLEEAAK